MTHQPGVYVPLRALFLVFHLKIIYFTAMKNRNILHRCVIVMSLPDSTESTSQWLSVYKQGRIVGLRSERIPLCRLRGPGNTAARIRQSHFSGCSLLYTVSRIIF